MLKDPHTVLPDETVDDQPDASRWATPRSS